MESVDKALKDFGLNEKERVVYLSCLKQEVTSPHAISKDTGIPRTTIYDILLNLSLKGLIELEQSDGFTKQQTKVRAKNPSVMRDLLAQKRKEINRVELGIVNILPILKKDFQKDKANADFRFYPGVAGLKKVYFDKEIASLDLESFTWDLLMPMDIVGHEELNRFTTEMNDRYKTRKHKPKEIVPLNDWTKHVLSYQFSRDPGYIETREIRYTENPILDLKVELQVVGDIVRITSGSEEEAWGLIINSKSLSLSLKSIFQVQWLASLPVDKKLVESWGKNEIWEQEQK